MLLGYLVSFGKVVLVDIKSNQIDGWPTRHYTSLHQDSSLSGFRPETMMLANANLAIDDCDTDDIR